MAIHPSKHRDHRIKATVLVTRNARNTLWQGDIHTAEPSGREGSTSGVYNGMGQKRLRLVTSFQLSVVSLSLSGVESAHHVKLGVRQNRSTQPAARPKTQPLTPRWQVI